MPVYIYEPILDVEIKQDRTCCYFETLQSINEDAFSTCPHCGYNVRRVIQAVSILPSFVIANESRKSTPTTSKDSRIQKISQITKSHICSAYCCHR